jgi:hypothetical protein
MEVCYTVLLLYVFEFLHNKNFKKNIFLFLKVVVKLVSCIRLNWLVDAENAA